ncbi:hypothetical protein [Candidatus Collinsella stercoripullorum]|uniref:hypothetical protein n=1 Tax=Candidatus Collinsella stercoripullorum TaxID=2838522 RepID=UPI0022E4189D|nr:hypothetical protein [Candidatus Collinsella stercoripullorum]
MPEVVIVPETCSDDETYITITEAVERGYGVRSTITRWAGRGVVRARRDGRRFLISVDDLERARAGRDGAGTAPDAVAALAREIAGRAPELSREGRARLAELLRG